jgi:hypothetical protein
VPSVSEFSQVFDGTRIAFTRSAMFHHVQAVHSGFHPIFRPSTRGAYEDHPLDHLFVLLGMVDRLDPDSFHSIEYELVDRYRNCEDEQERIAMAVTEANLRVHDPRSHERLDEMLAMLMTTHDPMI